MSIQIKRKNKTYLKDPPIITGLDIASEEINHYRHQSSPRLLTLDLELSLRCNLNCKYCYSEAGNPLKNELSISDFYRVISEASDLGAKMIVIVGGGEPLYYPYLRELIEYIENIGMNSLLFTNLTLIDEKWASFLWDKQIGIVGKINSFHPEIHDFLTGKKGSFKKAYESLEYLFEQGYLECDINHPLLALETVILEPNLAEIPEMWRYCRNSNIIPYFEFRVTKSGLYN